MATAEAIFENLNDNLFPLVKLVTGGGYLLGVLLVAKGLLKLRKVADYRSMMYQPVDVLPPLTMILAGVMLMWLPAIFKATTYSIFTTGSSLLSYDGVEARFTGYERVGIHTLQLIGLVSFIRGWLIIAKGNDQQGPSSGSKGLTHLVAGVLCYHIYPFYQVIKATLGV